MLNILDCELIKAVPRRLITVKEQMKVMANFLEIWGKGVTRSGAVPDIRHPRQSHFPRAMAWVILRENEAALKHRKHYSTRARAQAHKVEILLYSLSC